MSDTATQEPMQIIVAGQDEPAVPVTIIQKTKARQKQRYSTAKAMEATGVKVLRLKISTAKALKPHLEKVGIKTIGQCRILVGSDKAEEYLDALDADAKELQNQGGLSVDQRIEFERLKIELLKVIINSGVEYIRAERQVADQPTSPSLQIPYAAGTPVAVAIGTKKAELPASN